MSEDQDERMPVDYELELARGMAKDLLEQYPPANDGSEDRMEVHAASTINWLVAELEKRAPFAKGTFVTEQVVDTVARFHSEQFRGALEKIADFFEHDTWGGQIGFDMRQIARDVLKSVDR